jgi:hypothetical protein
MDIFGDMAAGQLKSVGLSSNYSITIKQQSMGTGKVQEQKP